MSEITPSDIRDVIIKEDDFGHEMRVGNVLRACSGAVVEHGGTYTDLVTDKPRQFDYRCWVQKQGSRLALAVECKKIVPSLPLVVCGTRRYRNEAFHELIESRQGRFDDGGIIYTGLSSVTRRVSVDNPFYPQDEFVGKSLVRVQVDKSATSRSGESEIYERWAQALSSAVELGTAATSLAKHLSMANVFTAILPVVVVPNGALWRAIYKDTGNLTADPNRVDECRFFIDREIEVAGPKGKPWFQTFTFSHVHFFTIDGLKSFLSEMVSDTSAWRRLFVDPAATVKVSRAYPRDPVNPSTR